jgi:hypothetical protein
LEFFDGEFVFLDDVDSPPASTLKRPRSLRENVPRQPSTLSFGLPGSLLTPYSNEYLPAPLKQLHQKHDPKKGSDHGRRDKFTRRHVERRIGYDPTECLHGEDHCEEQEPGTMNPDFDRGDGTPEDRPDLVIPQVFTH